MLLRHIRSCRPVHVIGGRPPVIKALNYSRATDASFASLFNRHPTICQQKLMLLLPLLLPLPLLPLLLPLLPLLLPLLLPPHCC